MNFSSAISTLRLLGLLEGISYLLLFGVGMPLKYMANLPEPNYIIGMLHGVLFVAYVIFCTICWFKYKWSFEEYVLAGLASLLPFATFYADSKIFKNYTPKH